MAGVTTCGVSAEEAGMRVDRWFREHYPGLPFGRLQKLLRSGQVRVDGGRVKSSTRLEQGQSIRVPPLEAEARPATAGAGLAGEGDAATLRAMLLHEDDAVYVFNKPAGLAVQGGSGLSRHVDGMLEALRDRRGQKPRLVHRLDRETAGVLVVAKTRLAAQRLSESFRARTTRKTYWALVKGIPRERQGRISTWLVKETGEDGDRMRVLRQRGKDSIHAVSTYTVVDQAAQNLAWLIMRPVTGRTHQLRVHAASMGQPIVGDSKYFDIENWELPGGMQNRLHLHARRIVVPHPAGGKLDVTAPLPPHMQQTWNLLGFDAATGDAAERETAER
ncbi:MAG: RluA family pseudouridine synthase [Alphaproteobacteria bacterium]